MDRRTLLALLLTAIVIVATPFIFPSPKRQPATPDTTAARDTAVSAAAPSNAAAPPAAAQTQTVGPTRTLRPGAAIRAETTAVETRHATYRLVSPGGTPASVTLPAYRSLREAATAPVDLIESGDRLFRLRIASERDTIALDSVAFRAAPQRVEGSAIIQTLTSVNSPTTITLTYWFQQDSFVTTLEGTIGSSATSATSAASGQRRLLVTLLPRIRSEERDQRDDARHLSFDYKVGNAEVKAVPYRDLDTLRMHADTGAIRWIAERNKYFVVAIAPATPETAFRAISFQGGRRIEREPTSAHATALLPLRGNAFGIRVYAGPQAWDHLRKTAPDLENVNPYGGWLHAVVQPFATIVMRLLLWIKAKSNVSYGWVLVIFGILVRMLLWPLNQNAMRSSMKLQRIQPQLADLQKRFKDNPEKQRDAMLKLYQEHGMSPFTPVLGCLPMLLPMPILFALYFVFQNTIELRGVSFLWLPDLSLKDPYFITPLFMGVSMFALSWIGMRGMPPSPQGKMMSYVMPVMFTALFWNFASGLNLYYAVQNVAALPQQWLLARERTAGPSIPTPIGARGTVRERG